MGSKANAIAEIVFSLDDESVTAVRIRQKHQGDPKDKLRETIKKALEDGGFGMARFSTHGIW